MVKTWASKARGTGVIRGQGAETPHATWRGWKKKKEWPESGYFEINPHDTNIPFELVSCESSG